MLEDVGPQRPGLNFCEAIVLPLGDPMRGSIPNSVIFIPSFNIFLLNVNNFLRT